MTEDLPIYYTTEEVLELLKIKQRTLYAYRKAGVLTGTRFGKFVRYRREEVRSLLEHGIPRGYIKASKARAEDENSATVPAPRRGDGE